MIKKEDVLQLIDDQLKRTADSYTMDDAAEVVLLMIRNKVENMPEAVVRAKWIPQNDIFTKFMCSRCEQIDYNVSGNFCPYCGADMRGEK